MICHYTEAGIDWNQSHAPWYEAVFHARMAEKLEAAGYGIRRTDHNFELASVSRELVEKFSKRTKLIEELEKQRGGWGRGAPISTAPFVICGVQHLGLTPQRCAIWSLQLW
jgi:conjugative relaxase-like TrwC/TraI family protein